jgi:hypothetical protein
LHRYLNRIFSSYKLYCSFLCVFFLPLFCSFTIFTTDDCISWRLVAFWVIKFATRPLVSESWADVLFVLFICMLSIYTRDCWSDTSSFIYIFISFFVQWLGSLQPAFWISFLLCSAGVLNTCSANNNAAIQICLI